MNYKSLKTFGKYSFVDKDNIELSLLLGIFSLIIWKYGTITLEDH